MVLGGGSPVQRRGRSFLGPSLVLSWSFLGPSLVLPWSWWLSSAGDLKWVVFLFERWIKVLPLSRALFGGGTFGGIWTMVLPHSRGPCLLVVILGGSGPWFFLTLEGLLWWWCFWGIWTVVLPLSQGPCLRASHSWE